MMLPRLVADKIGSYLYHWKHIKLMEEMKNKINIYGNSIYLINKNNGTKLYNYRHISSLYRRYIKTNLGLKVAYLPKIYWYSNGDPPFYSYLLE